MIVSWGIAAFYSKADRLFFLCPTCFLAPAATIFQENNSHSAQRQQSRARVKVTTHHFIFLPPLRSKLHRAKHLALRDKEMETLESSNLQFALGSVHILSGPTGAGKTRRLGAYLRMKEELFEMGKDIKNVVFFYSVWQREYELMEQDGLVSEWIKGSPTNAEFLQAVQDSPCSIVVIDDGMAAINEEMLQIVTVSARHTKSTTFLLFQSLFPPARLGRQISLQAKYLHLFKNPRDRFQINVIAKQLCPIGSKFIVDAYMDATALPYGCLLIDLHQDTPESLRFRTNILPSEWPMIAYVKK